MNLPKEGTQNRTVLDWLMDGGTVSDLEALRMWRIRRLAARINDLRAMGFPIRTDVERHQSGTHARYRWDEGQGELFA